MQQSSSWSISRSPFHSVLVQGNALRVGGRLHGSPAHQRVFAHRVVPVARPQARYSRSSQGTWETGSFPWILHDISIFCQLWLWKLYFILLNWDMYNIFTVICQLLTGDECGIVGGPSPSLGPLMCASTTSKARPGRVDRWPPRKNNFYREEHEEICGNWYIFVARFLLSTFCSGLVAAFCMQNFSDILFLRIPKQRQAPLSWAIAAVHQWFDACHPCAGGKCPTSETCYTSRFEKECSRVVRAYRTTTLPLWP